MLIPLLQIYQHGHRRSSCPSYLLGRFITVAAQPQHVSATSVSRDENAGFQPIPQRLLNVVELDSNCQRAAKQLIKCHEGVDELGRREYHGSLGDSGLTDLVCAPSCKQALVTARENIEMTCAGSPNLLPGMAVVSIIDSILTGWEETCLKDEQPGDCCNRESVPMTLLS